MNVQDSAQSEATTHHLLDDQFDALKAGVRKLIDRVSSKPAAEVVAEAPEPTRVRRYARSFAGKAMEMVSAHPIAATALALGVGYVAVRIARR